MKSRYYFPFRLFFIIIFLCWFKDIKSQDQSKFDIYIDSLLKVNRSINYRDIVSFENMNYDTVNKENNFGNWIGACFKILGINNYLTHNSNLFKSGTDLHIQVYVDSFGIVQNVVLNEKKLEKYLNQKLRGSNFFKDYIDKVKINGICIPKVDDDFYRNYFQFNNIVMIKFGEDNSNFCNCNNNFK